MERVGLMTGRFIFWILPVAIKTLRCIIPSYLFSMALCLNSNVTGAYYEKEHDYVVGGN